MSRVGDYLATLQSAWKLLTAIAVGVTATAVYLTTFQTDAEAGEWRAGHLQAETCRTVQELKAEIREKEAQIRFDRALTDEDREWLREQIAAIREDIRRYDPDGKC